MNASLTTDSLPLSPEPGRARHQLRRLLRNWGWPGEVDAVVLAVHEAIANSNRHAGGATGASVESGRDGRTLVVEVRDSGPGFSFNHYAGRPPDPLAEKGRGLWLISQIAESYAVQRADGETRLRMRFRP